MVQQRVSRRSVEPIRDVSSGLSRNFRVGVCHCSEIPRRRPVALCLERHVVHSRCLPEAEIIKHVLHFNSAKFRCCLQYLSMYRYIENVLKTNDDPLGFHYAVCCGQQ